MSRLQFIGLEDIVNDNKFHTMSCLCEKQAEVWVMSRIDFVKLQTQTSVWKVFSRIVDERINRLSRHIVKSSLAEA